MSTCRIGLPIAELSRAATSAVLNASGVGSHAKLRSGFPVRGERVVVCHSLGCMLWLHHCARATPAQQVDRVLLVAPPSPGVLWRAVESFRPPALRPEALAAVARCGVRLVCSDGDPYCPEGGRALFATPLELEFDLIPGGGHLSEADGYGPWPSMTAWCLDPAVRLGANAT